MKQKHTAVLLTLALLLLLAAGAAVLAQTSAGFNLEWHVIGSGGGESASTDYHVNGTIGQSTASQPDMGSAGFQLSSGYWFVGASNKVFLPVLVKN